MFEKFGGVFIQWGIFSISLWVASHLVTASDFPAPHRPLFPVAVFRFCQCRHPSGPLLFVLTFPLTLLTLGFSCWVINADVDAHSKLVEWLSFPDFGRFLQSMFISIMSMLLSSWVLDNETTILPDAAARIRFRCDLGYFLSVAEFA